MTLVISGKTAIVTGAAHGIGLAITRHFLDRGVRVMCADLDEEKLEAEFGESAREDGPARYFAGDLCQKLTVNNLLSATADAFEHIDILVNAARTFQTNDALDPSGEALDQMLTQNMRGALRMSQMTAKRMIALAEKEGRTTGEVGCIVNVSSLAGSRSRPETLAYSVACAAQDQATRSLAVALAPHRIRVNAISFASVMSASLQATLKDHPDWRDEIVAGTPLGRIAPASDIVDTVQYLASPGAAFVTGQTIQIDGGRSLIDPVRVPAF